MTAEEVCKRSGKIVYPGKGAAKRAVAGKKLHSPGFKGPIEDVYRCPYCKGYHLSRQIRHKGKGK